MSTSQVEYFLSGTPINTLDLNVVSRKEHYKICVNATYSTLSGKFSDYSILSNLILMSTFSVLMVYILFSVQCDN